MSTASSLRYHRAKAASSLKKGDDIVNVGRVLDCEIMEPHVYLRYGEARSYMGVWITERQEYDHEAETNHFAADFYLPLDHRVCVEEEVIS